MLGFLLGSCRLPFQGVNRCKNDLDQYPNLCIVGGFHLSASHQVRPKTVALLLQALKKHNLFEKLRNFGSLHSPATSSCSRF
jgi:hypothetical protein